MPNFKEEDEAHLQNEGHDKEIENNHAYLFSNYIRKVNCNNAQYVYFARCVRHKKLLTEVLR